MKTFKNLYPKICDSENLWLASRRARRGKRLNVNVAGFEYDLEENLAKLKQELVEQTYQPGGYTNFYITEPKKRKISAAPFRDRVVHHAICNVIEPIWENRFIYDSYACRVGKGTHKAIDRCQQFIKGNEYFLKCDIKQFFPSIDHKILLEIISRKITGCQTLELIEKIIASGRDILASEYDMSYFQGDDLFASLRPRGLPIGNLTSQFLANVYMNELDQFVKNDLKCRDYIRYVDDFILFAGDKEQLHQWKRAIAEYLAGLRLTLHPQKCYVAPAKNGVEFLGFNIYPGQRKLRRENIIRFKRRLVRFKKLYDSGLVPLPKISESIRCWCAHAAHGNTYGLRKALMGGVVF